MQLRLNDLREQLKLVTPHDATEEAHLARMNALCEAGNDPCARGHFTPGHFTASAFILSPERDALLLILHGKLGRWLQPGGHIDERDSSVLAAARREAVEEVGLTDLALLQEGPFDVDVHDIPAFGDSPSHAHFDVRFLFRAPSRTFLAGSDAKAARWVPLSEVSLEISDQSVMRAVEKLR